jgi:hypothetical protein
MEPLTVHVPVHGEMQVPITAKTRVAAVLQTVGERIGEAAPNLRMVVAGGRSELPPDLRVCSLPPTAHVEVRIKNIRRTLAVDNVNTPRLVPSVRVVTKIRMCVSADDCPARLVAVSPDDPVAVLREICRLPIGERYVVQCGGRTVVDERKSFRELSIAERSEIHFAAASGERSTLPGGEASSAAVERTAPSQAALEGSYLAERPEDLPLGLEGGHTARRRLRGQLGILFEDPDDRGYTHELEVATERSVGSLLQFVEAPLAYDVLCDGRVVADLNTSFLVAADGYDGSLFTFRRLEASPAASPNRR